MMTMGSATKNVKMPTIPPKIAAGFSSFCCSAFSKNVGLGWGLCGLVGRRFRRSYDRRAKRRSRHRGSEAPPPAGGNDGAWTAMNFNINTRTTSTSVLVFRPRSADAGRHLNEGRWHPLLWSCPHRLLLWHWLIQSAFSLEVWMECVLKYTR